MAADSEFFDDLEVRAPEQREADNFAALPGLIDHAKANAPYFGDLLKDVDGAAVTDRAALAALPVTRKSDLLELQKKDPPLGGVAATPLGRMLWCELKIRLPECMLARTDRMTMAVSLEGRTPFLDHRLVEHVLRLPDRDKVQGRQEKRILKQALQAAQLLEHHVARGERAMAPRRVALRQPPDPGFERWR